MSENELIIIDGVLAEVQGEILPWANSQKDNPCSNFLRRLPEGTRRTMRYALQEVADKLGAYDIPIEEVMWHKVERAHLLALVERMRTEGYAKSTCKVYLAALRGVFNECEYLNLLPLGRLTALRDVKAFKEDRLPTGRFIEELVLKRLFADCANDQRYQGIRDAAIIALLYGSGLRRAESVAAQIDKLDQVNWTLAVIGKGNKEVLKQVAPGAVKRIKAWLALRNEHIAPEGALFTRIRKGRKIKQTPDEIKEGAEVQYSPGVITSDGMTPQAIYYILAQRSEAIGFKVRPHDLRRTFITEMIEQHGDGMAMLLADHANLSTTLIYDMRGDKQKAKAMQSRDF